MRVYETVTEGKISIHALRVEGDNGCTAQQSTGMHISIHALRVEGDLRWRSRRDGGHYISIHALRVEGDATTVRFHTEPR